MGEDLSPIRLSSTPYPGLSCGAGAKPGNPTLPSPQPLHTGGDPKVFPDQQRDIVSPEHPRSSPAQEGHAMNTSKGRRPGGI